jgi:hypothetical protein
VKTFHVVDENGGRHIVEADAMRVVLGVAELYCGQNLVAAFPYFKSAKAEKQKPDTNFGIHA